MFQPPLNLTKMSIHVLTQLHCDKEIYIYMYIFDFAFVLTGMILNGISL